MRDKNNENLNNDNNEKQLTVKEKKTKMKKEGTKARWLFSGLTTALLAIIILDIYILANILLDKVTLPEFDFTENKIYSLSEETKTKLKNLDANVKITLINYEDTSSVTRMAEKYVILNNKIEMERINDLASRKDIMDKYSLDTTSQLIVITSGDKEKTLNEYELYTYDYSTYETIDTTEEGFTNAIVDVTTADKPKIYFMSNHAQYEIKTYFNTLTNLMKEDANEVEVLDVLKAGSIPEDCDTLIITTLSEDITEFEKDKIIDYINRGGELLILNGPNISKKDLTNYQSILDLYGVSIEEGVIFEGNSSNMLYGYPDFIIEEMEHSSITEKLNMNLTVCLADSASIKFDEEKQEKLKLEYESLIYTTDKAFRRTDLTITSSSKTKSDSEEAKFTVASFITKTIDENKTSKLIIFGNELFASDMQEPFTGYNYPISSLYNNSDVVLNSIAYLNEREDIITIRKTYDSVTYTATELQHNIIMIVIFIIPLIIIALGIVVWQVRRRKK